MFTYVCACESTDAYWGWTQIYVHMCACMNEPAYTRTVCTQACLELCTSFCKLPPVCICTPKWAWVCLCSQVDTPRSICVKLDSACTSACTSVQTRPILHVQVTVLICQYLGVRMGTGERGKQEGRASAPSASTTPVFNIGPCPRPRPLQGLPLLLKWYWSICLFLRLSKCPNFKLILSRLENHFSDNYIPEYYVFNTFEDSSFKAIFNPKLPNSILLKIL